MTRACRNRWILVAALWVGAAVLALWNLEAIGHAVTAAQTQATLGANRQFLAGNQEQLQALEERLATLTRPVDSPSFGLLYLQQELSALATGCGLSEFKLTGEPAAGGGAIPVSVGFSGRLSGATCWLAAVQQRMPYVVLSGLEVESDPQAVDAAFKVTLLLRYQIAEPRS
jgi:hypothetical protein